jgi:hypothetical protein
MEATNQNKSIEKGLPVDVIGHLKSEKRVEESWEACLIRLVREHKRLAYDLPEYIYMARVKY